jgi:hypothetical protein
VDTKSGQGSVGTDPLLGGDTKSGQGSVGTDPLLGGWCFGR